MVKIRRHDNERLTKYVKCGETNFDILDRVFNGYDTTYLLNKENAKTWGIDQKKIKFYKYIVFSVAVKQGFTRLID